MKNAHVQLFDQMLAVFNEEDIIELCFRLNIVYADLNGKNRRAKTISLIETCQYEGRMTDLMKLCQEQRPTVVWPTTPLDAASANSTLADVPSSSSGTYCFSISIGLWV